MAIHPILYGKEGHAEYIGIERAREAIVAIDEFMIYRKAFEDGDLKRGERKTYANNILNDIRVIKALVPNEIRAVLPEHFGLSEHALGKLEKKCDIVLGRVRILPHID